MKSITLFSSLFALSFISFSQCEDFEMTTLLFHPTCPGFSDGSVTIELEGGELPYEATLTHEEGEVEDFMGGTINVLLAGCYYIHGVDAAGCELFDTIKLIDPGEMEATMILTHPETVESCDGIAACDTVFNYQGDYEMLSYYWSPLGEGGIGLNTVDDLCAGEYLLTIADAFGCVQTVDFEMIATSGISNVSKYEIQLYYDSGSNTLVLKNKDFRARHLRLFSPTGQVVFETLISPGENRLNPKLESAVYVYQIATSTNLLLTGKIPL